MSSINLDQVPNPDADGLVGAITPYAGETLPGPKYRWCHGTQTLSRTEFSLLFARLGESWGVGDGSTTFNLPNLNKQFLVGFDESATGAVSGTTGAGSAHSHGFSGTTGTENLTTARPLTPADDFVSDSGHTHGFSGTTDSESAHTHSFSGTAAVIPPAKVVRYIIKVA
jgi:microcystin-dependent protein